MSASNPYVQIEGENILAKNFQTTSRKLERHENSRCMIHQNITVLLNGSIVPSSRKYVLCCTIATYRNSSGAKRHNMRYLENPYMDSNPWGHDTVRNFDRQETRLVDYPSLGCRVRVHDTSGSKLDGRSKVGRWMGLDDETGDGHRIYWPEKRSVTVERSVKFNFADEVIIGTLPLEGEEPATVEQSIPPLPSETPIPDIVISEPDAIEPTEELGRGKRVRKESEYVWMLSNGNGTTSACPNNSLLPKGL